MRFSRPLLRLPIKFSAEALAGEVNALPPSAWTAHPMQFKGNTAVRLITTNGDPTDLIEGSMAPTPQLLACPQIMHAMAAIGAVWGRSRLMGLAPGTEVPAHIDSHYYWRTHIRIHIPLITNPDVSFTCGDETVHMEAGECWVFDSFLRHEVHNRGSETRVHLVLDTVGGGRLHDLIAAAEAGVGDQEPRFVAPAPAAVDSLAFEKVNVPAIMSPWEIRCHVDFIVSNTPPHPSLDAVVGRIGRFIDDWAAMWAQFGEDESASGRYAQLLARARMEILKAGADRVPLANGVPLQHVFDRLILEAAVRASRRAPPRQQVASTLRKAS